LLLKQVTPVQIWLGAQKMRVCYKHSSFFVLMLKYMNMPIKDLFKNYIYPVAMFSGGVIGVGFLSLPYVMAKAGFWVTLFYFVAITAIIILINLIFCDISLATPDYKRFPGFAEYHLGKWAKNLALVLGIFGSFAVLLAYIVVGGQFLSNLFGAGQSLELVYALIFFVMASVFVFFGVKAVAKAEFWILCFLFLSVILIFFKGFWHINLQNIFISNFKFEISNLFLPYGPILFAMWGTGLIPQVEEAMAENKNKIKKIIVISTLICAVFYFLFAVLIFGIMGSATTEIAFDNIGKFVGKEIAFVGFLAGALITFVAFIVQALLLKESLMYDVKIKSRDAFIISCFTPFILFLFGFKSFISILSVTGGVLLGISGILILLMYKKIGGKKIIIYPLSLIFLLGVIYEIVYFLR
jgi:tyrosine-specific transport protein